MIAAHPVSRWPDTPRRARPTPFVLAALVAFLPIAASAQLSGVYSVASGGDYESVGAAVADLLAQGVSGPVTMQIAAGTWTEFGPPGTSSELIDGGGRVIDISAGITGISATNTVTFEAAPGATAADVILDRSDTSNARSPAVASIRSNYVILRNLTFRFSDFSVLPNAINDLVQLNPAVAPLVGGVLEGCVLDGAGLVGTGLKLTNSSQSLRVEGNLFGGFANSISMQTGSHTAALIEDNDLTFMRDVGSFDGFAIAVSNSVDLALRSNRLDYTSSRGPRGIVLANGQGALIEGNRIFDLNAPSGTTDFLTAIDFTNLSDSAIVDNMISGHARDGIRAIVLRTSTAVTVAHNSIRTSNATVALAAASIRISGQGGHDIRNNIIVLEGSGGIAFNILLTNENIDHIIESNVIHLDSQPAFSRVAVTSTGEYATLQDWQAVGFGSGSVDIRPEFADPNDLHLEGCSAADPELLGAPLAHPAVATDFDDEAREPLIARMGADQVNTAAADLFAPAFEVQVGGIPIDLAFGNFDGDADLDLAVSRIATGPGSIELFENAGDGSFTPSNSLAPGAVDERDPSILRAGDIDNDGFVDLVTIMANIPSGPSDQVQIYWGRSAGGFDGPLAADIPMPLPGDPGNVGPFTQAAWDIELADLDADGDLEILVNEIGIAGVTPSVIHVLCNSGSRVFGPVPTDSFLPNSVDLVVGDLDNDGDPDAITGGEFGPGLAHENVAGGCTLTDTKVTWAGILEGASSALEPSTAAVRLDSDVFADLIYDGDDTLAPDRVFLQRGNGDGTFATPEPLILTDLPERRPGLLVPFDHDDDNDLDLFVGNRGPIPFFTPGRGFLLVNGGEADFTERLICGDVGMPGAPRKIVTADLDADPYDDIATVMWNSEKVAILLNASGGGGLPTQQIDDFAGSFDGGTVALTWSTPSEIQNAGFGVERREDPAGAWSQIGSVPGVGISEVEQLYAFDDVAAPTTPTGEADYRLRQVNFDGSVQYIGPLTVGVPEPAMIVGLIPGLGMLVALARRRA